MAGKGTEYFLNESSKIDEASEACALLLVQGISLATSPEGRPEILLIRDTLAELAETNGQRLARHRSRSANVYTGEAAQIDKQGKVLRSAVSALNEMLSDDEASDDTPPRRPMPDVVGQPLSVGRTCSRSSELTWSAPIPRGGVTGTTPTGSSEHRSRKRERTYRKK